MNFVSLFTGYGGLDMALEPLLELDLIAVSDFDKNVSKLLDARYPDVPNLGDIKTINWSDYSDMELAISGGYPCQPFSSIGKRLGDQDERHLWPEVLKGIQITRPQHVFLENVRGHLSMGFNKVIADLTESGYEVRWSIVAAKSVGAAHVRDRLYIYAVPNENVTKVEIDNSTKVSNAGFVDETGYNPCVRLDKADFDKRKNIITFPTPLARDQNGPSSSSRRAGGGYGLGDFGDYYFTNQTFSGWGDKDAAIRDWEGVMGRPAPNPTILNPGTGRMALSHYFVEWLMGLPKGRVTDLDFSRRQALKILGNGVVPQAANYAYTKLMKRENFV